MDNTLAQILSAYFSQALLLQKKDQEIADLTNRIKELEAKTTTGA